MRTQSTAPGFQNRIATIQAKPHAVAVDVAISAVIVVDLQDDFGAEGADRVIR